MKKTLFWILFFLTGLAVIIAYLFIGKPNTNIITQVRIPRLLLTLFTGMALAGIGSIYQLMLANPLAEPYILGISSGAAFGSIVPVSYTHLRAHETVLALVCRLLLENKNHARISLRYQVYP